MNTQTVKKQVVVTSNTRKGENLFHCWNASQSFHVFTQRGKRGIDAAFADLSKQYPRIVMSVTHAAPKSNIIAYYA